MRDDSTPSLKEPEILFTSCFGIGFLPKAPGTWGSLATIPFLWFLGNFEPPFFLFIPFLFLLTLGSILVTEMVQQKYKIHDPSWIVIDEVLGMFVTWLFIRTGNWAHLALIFVLFRFFDIVKIWPASYFDKSVKHGAGTIIDDVVSGIYAGALCWLILTYGKNLF